MLTGDHQITAEAIATELGVTDVRAGLMPEDKLTAIKQLSDNMVVLPWLATASMMHRP